VPQKLNGTKCEITQNLSLQISKILVQSVKYRMAQFSQWLKAKMHPVRFDPEYVKELVKNKKIFQKTDWIGRVHMVVLSPVFKRDLKPVVFKKYAVRESVATDTR
jgi:type II secretory pathway component PulC